MGSALAYLTQRPLRALKIYSHDPKQLDFISPFHRGVICWAGTTLEWVEMQRNGQKLSWWRLCTHRFHLGISHSEAPESTENVLT